MSYTILIKYSVICMLAFVNLSVNVADVHVQLEKKRIVFIYKPLTWIEHISKY